MTMMSGGATVSNGGANANGFDHWRRAGELYRSALNSSVRRLILEAAPPRIHKS